MIIVVTIPTVIMVTLVTERFFLASLYFAKLSEVVRVSGISQVHLNEKYFPTNSVRVGEEHERDRDRKIRTANSSWIAYFMTMSSNEGNFF